MPRFLYILYYLWNGHLAAHSVSCSLVIVGLLSSSYALRTAVKAQHVLVTQFVPRITSQQGGEHFIFGTKRRRGTVRGG